mgnify:CR=1 FL=1
MNEIVRASERIAYGFTDVRAAFGTMPPDYWHVIWMAVSCCCGLEGPTMLVGGLPLPIPKVIREQTARAS